MTEHGKHWAVAQAEREEAAQDFPGCLSLLFVAILFTVLAVASLSRAQVEATPMHGPAGAPGIWLPIEDFRLAVQNAESVPRYVEQIRLLNEALSLAHTEIEQRTTAQAASDSEIAALGESIQVLIGQVREASTRATVAETERDAWYRSPLFLIGVGLIVGILGVGAIWIGVAS